MHSTLYLCVRTCRRCERRGPTAACVSCVPALHPAPHAAPPPPHTSPPHTALRRTHAHSALLHSGPSHSYNYSETMLTMAALPAGVTPSTTSSSQQTDGGGRDTWGISRHEACILLTVFGCESSPISRNVRSSVRQSVRALVDKCKVRPIKAQ